MSTWMIVGLIAGAAALLGVLAWMTQGRARARAQAEQDPQNIYPLW